MYGVCQVLDYCNASAKEYKCIFTSGATAALKMIGEAFPWTSQSCFMYTMENHNSVVGIREYPFYSMELNMLIFLASLYFSIGADVLLEFFLSSEILYI